MKKSLLLLLMLCVFIAVSQAQTTVEIGSGTTTNMNLPMACNWGYNYSQSIYYKSEITNGMTISRIGYNYTGTSWTDSDVKIYMGHTVKTAFTSTSDWIPIANMTQVFSGAVSVYAGWVEITLNTPFVYNGIDNLVIAFDENTPGFHTINDKFYGTAGAINRTIRYRNDTINPDPAAAALVGDQIKGFANIKLISPSSTPVFTAFPSIKDFGQTQITTQSADQIFTINNAGSGTINISSLGLFGDNSTEFMLTDSNTYPVLLNAGQNIKVRARLTPTITGMKNAVIKIEADTKVIHNINLTGSAFDAYISTLPFSEGFEGSLFPPLGWANKPINYTTVPEVWSRATFGSNPQCLAHNESDGLARFRSFSFPVGTSAILVSPMITANATDLRVDFWMYRDDEEIEHDSVNVYTNITDNLTGAILLGTIHRRMLDSPITEESGWQQYGFNFTKTAPSQYIILNGVSDFGNDIYIDDLVISAGTSIETNRIIANCTLFQNYPNPFNPATTIALALAKEANINLTVYNTKGEVVKTLINSNFKAGNHSVNFNANGLNSGVYIYKLSTPETSFTKKMILVK